jgi:plastocyanin
MQTRWFSPGVAAICLVAACTQPSPSRPSSVGADGSAATQKATEALPLAVTVAFGRPDTGSPFPPPSGHDQSSHAKDNLVPRTVVIAQGGTVTFDLSGPGRAIHQVAVYPDGTDPGDVDVTALAPPAAGCPPVPRIVDPDGIVLAAQPCAGGSTSPSYTFTQPGRYLVICTFLPHFAEFQMYGWVIVK